jgi:hypothetical protein
MGLRIWCCPIRISTENMVSEPKQVLTAGVQLLDSLMQSYGFVYTATTVGVGSGGAFAAGEFRRGDRSASVKPAAPGRGGAPVVRGGPGSADPGFATLENIDLFKPRGRPTY